MLNIQNYKKVESIEEAYELNQKKANRIVGGKKLATLFYEPSTRTRLSFESADFINPFLMSATKIMQEICQTEMKIGKPYVKTTEFENESVAVMIGITGELKGQVIMAFEFNKALDVASKMMMGMPVTALDDMSISAISELGRASA